MAVFETYTDGYKDQSLSGMKQRWLVFRLANLIELKSQFQVGKEDLLTGPAWFLVSEFDYLTQLDHLSVSSTNSDLEVRLSISQNSGLERRDPALTLKTVLQAGILAYHHGLDTIFDLYSYENILFLFLCLALNFETCVHCRNPFSA